MSRFAEDAQNIFDAAENASRLGQPCSEMTVLLGVNGSIHLVADSDWPLDSLIRHHGARTGYRVSGNQGSVRVEGREGSRTCLLESPDPARTARLLLAHR